MTMMNCSLRRFIRSTAPISSWAVTVFLVMGAGCLALVLVVLQNIYTAVIGVVVFLVMLLITRLMAKNDAQLRPVYRRYAKFQRYYPAAGVKYLHKPSHSLRAR
ncbi:VirB3 family type IV secretion system protein [Vibrio parahaemolyticus]|uniref:VirB3 family type IV secretion system protein n=1 Tax=Vibrio parahaemolyticus TaxID=670 RepID=UPI001F3687B7|nr:VirB3 family type IV secretion system protein [Vibrio parahaemolyticus]